MNYVQELARRGTRESSSFHHLLVHVFPCTHTYRHLPEAGSLQRRPTEVRALSRSASCGTAEKAEWQERVE
jgi:hypothetical protein